MPLPTEPALIDALEALDAARDFITRVQTWIGGYDDELDEVLTTLTDAIKRIDPEYDPEYDGDDAPTEPTTSDRRAG